MASITKGETLVNERNLNYLRGYNVLKIINYIRLIIMAVDFVENPGSTLSKQGNPRWKNNWKPMYIINSFNRKLQVERFPRVFHRIFPKVLLNYQMNDLEKVLLFFRCFGMLRPSEKYPPKSIQAHDKKLFLSLFSVQFCKGWWKWKKSGTK